MAEESETGNCYSTGRKFQLRKMNEARGLLCNMMPIAVVYCTLTFLSRGDISCYHKKKKKENPLLMKHSLSSAP